MEQATIAFLKLTLTQMKNEFRKLQIEQESNITISNDRLDKLNKDINTIEQHINKLEKI